MRGCFFGKTPQPEVAFLLRVLDCSDLLDLAGMYGEARDGFKNAELMMAVNKRMEEVQRLGRERFQIEDVKTVNGQDV